MLIEQHAYKKNNRWEMNGKKSLHTKKIAHMNVG